MPQPSTVQNTSGWVEGPHIAADRNSTLWLPAERAIGTRIAQAGECTIAEMMPHDDATVERLWEWSLGALISKGLVELKIRS